MAHSDRALHKHKPSECSTWSAGQRTLWTQDIWNNVFYRRHVSVSSPAVTQHPSDDSQWRHPLRHRHLFRPRPTQPIIDNEVILLHQQFSHPMDRAVAHLRLFLGDIWMDGCWFPGLPLKDNISSFLPDFIPRLNIYSLISKEMVSLFLALLNK